LKIDEQVLVGYRCLHELLLFNPDGSHEYVFI